MITMGVGWAMAYLLIVFRSFRDRTCGMPFWALAFNISWEFYITTLVSKEYTDGHLPELTFNYFWVALDIFILIAYFRYGRQEWPGTVNRKLFYPYSLSVIVLAYLFIALMSMEFQDPAGIYVSFIQCLMMSVLFINMLIVRNSLSGQSIGIAFFKMAGTLAATIGFARHSHFKLFLGSACFIADMIYLVMVAARYREQKIPVLSLFRRSAGSVSPIPLSPVR